MAIAQSSRQTEDPGEMDWSGDRLALQHLLLRLKPLNRALKAAAEARAEGNTRLARPDLRPVGITEQHVHQLFAVADRLVDGQPGPAVSLALTAAEARAEESLRSRATEDGSTLPLDALREQLDLSPLEVHALLICAAPQLHTAYERIFGYIHDDIHRLAPSLELINTILAPDMAAHLAARDCLQPHGKLCRLGLLRIASESANELHREYALGPDVLRALMRCETDWPSLFRDPHDIDTGAAPPLRLFPNADELQRIARLLSGDGDYLVGLWGKGHHGVSDVAAALAAAAARPLRQLPLLSDMTEMSHELRTARALGAALWIDTDVLAREERRQHEVSDRLVELLVRWPLTVVLTGAVPWYPLELLAHKNLVDVHLGAPTPEQRAALWGAVVADASPATCRQLAERYQLSPREMRAVAGAARIQTRLKGNGVHHPADRALWHACRAVSLRRGAQFAKVVTPRRRPEDLILPPELHRRVLEIAAFHRNWSRVDESWGFGRLLTGGGLKVLLTGDSGTGKTAAAEVITREVGEDQVLLKVHLASVVSKWVGETEKNLDAVFEHAEESHAILFFDEADALFAKRAEVERGADRYANLEVGFLLQRLEDFSGLAILASNHKDQIDEAFMRRFQMVLHFPRPGVAERRRLWQMALPAQAPQADNIDIDLLQQLDLTGAGIVSAARTAALLAAQHEDGRIGMAQLVRAVSRQFQNEARLLPKAQLGPFAHLADSAA